MRHARQHRHPFEAIRRRPVCPRQHVRTDRRILRRRQAVIGDIRHRRHRHTDHLGCGITRIVGEGHGEAVAAVPVRRRGVAPQAGGGINARRPVRRTGGHGKYAAVAQPVRIARHQGARHGRVFGARPARAPRHHRRIVHRRHVEGQSVRSTVIETAAVSNREGEAGIPYPVRIGRWGKDQIAGGNVGDGDDLARCHGHPRQGQAAGGRNRINPHRAQTVARIHITEPKVRGGQNMGRIFINRDRGIGPRRGFIDVGHIDCEGFVIREPAAVGHPNRHAMARGGFIVQQAAVRHRDLSGRTVDRKSPTRIIREAVGLGIPRIRIRPRRRPYHRPVRRVLRHGIRRQTQTRRHIVDRSNGDRGAAGSLQGPARALRAAVAVIESPVDLD